ncbi:IS66 family insertion sequence element accessory protein TnpA [Xenorhabdus bovienii]|uniref:IS66 family insertion sequence element accessory protein TnpA n=1 Tax=Xenorhabdus bovienii TaxID=40576 RepID=UPI0023B29C7E|nr:hypothetical protein [Xenorhabdus bovienii]
MRQSKFTQAEWLDIFEQQKKSPLTVPQFCQKIGVSTTRFYHHRQRAAGSQEKTAEPVAPSAFIKVSDVQKKSVSSRHPPSYLKRRMAPCVSLLARTCTLSLRLFGGLPYENVCGCAGRLLVPLIY